jgi:hypothetical protein
MPRDREGKDHEYAAPRSDTTAYNMTLPCFVDTSLVRLCTKFAQHALSKLFESHSCEVIATRSEHNYNPNCCTDRVEFSLLVALHAV